MAWGGNARRADIKTNLAQMETSTSALWKRIAPDCHLERILVRPGAVRLQHHTTVSSGYAKELGNGLIGLSRNKLCIGTGGFYTFIGTGFAR